MILNFATSVRLILFPATMLALWPFVAAATATSDTKSWSLISPNKTCEITVVLSNDGSLNYEAYRDGKMVIKKSPMGLRCNDQDWDRR